MAPKGDCHKRSLNISGLRIKMTNACTMLFDPVCGSDGRIYSSSCNAASTGMSILNVSEYMNVNKSPKRSGSRFFTWLPNYDCYKKCWPQCCLDDGQECPPDRHPRCDNQSNQGWNYCTWAPDTTCYASGWPACCDR